MMELVNKELLEKAKEELNNAINCSSTISMTDLSIYAEEKLELPKENDVITIKDEYGEFKVRVIKINEGKQPWESTMTVERIN